MWETLYFTAILSMPSCIPMTKKLERIHSIVDSFGLQNCLHTVVGDIFTRGLSGGERKRATIACELLRDPDILLVDEPTSGLDTSAAHNLMVQLKNYATQHKKIIVTTIHQPSSQVFLMFSTLLLLVEGQVAYFGSAGCALDYLTSLGIPFEDEYNPADILLEVVTSRNDIISIIKQAGLHKRYNSLLSARRFPQGSQSDVAEIPKNDDNSGSAVLEIVVGEGEKTHRWPSSFWTQLTVLSWRSFKQAKGNMSLLDVALPVVLAITASLIFFQIGNLETSARDKLGLVFFTFAFMGFDMSSATVKGLDAERGVVYKERTAGIYRLSAYYLSKMISEIPVVLVNPVVMVTIIYWVAGLGGVDGYVVYLSIGILYNLMMQSVALVIGLFSVDLRFNMGVVMMCLDASFILGGFYVVNPPEWLWWCKYLAFFHYPSAATLTYLMSDIPPVWCNQTSVNIYPQCIDNGNLTLTSRDVLNGLGIEHPVYFYVTIMAMTFGVFRTCGYFVLRLKKI
ncbi:ABC transporter G family member 21-like [Mizuhopecten yessoensis]|uniref:ABC transporter G family member 21-like n=1 Tax=Mizuhopecten yessoensis TaxID=6573 RepID=UPI000B45EC90|nr:ABC transporter G family member 21-like [Mizuhopecten yessoensis]